MLCFPRNTPIRCLAKILSQNSIFRLIEVSQTSSEFLNIVRRVKEEHLYLYFFSSSSLDAQHIRTYEFPCLDEPHRSWYRTGLAGIRDPSLSGKCPLPAPLPLSVRR